MILKMTFSVTTIKADQKEHSLDMQAYFRRNNSSMYVVSLKGRRGRSGGRLSALKTKYKELLELSLNNNFVVKVCRTEQCRKSRLMLGN